MSSKTIGQVAGFVLGAALIAAGIFTGGLTTALGTSLIIQGGLMIVTQAIVDLTQPHVPARQASEMSIQLGEQPRSMQMGETFSAGSLVDGFNYGGKYGTDWEVLIIRLADHKCHSLTGFYVNDEYNVYTGDGPLARYKDKLEIYFRSDTTNQTIASVVTDHGPGWTAADIGESGCDVVVAYKADKPDAKHPVWPGGRPRFGFVIKGALCYDPRLDDTVTGGSGSHRYDDPDTWEWSENAVICRYKWVRGVYANDDVTDQSKLLVGRGLTAEEAPPENIFAAANLCDTVEASVFPYAQRDTTINDIADSNQMNVSGDGQWMVRRYTDRMEIWSLPTLTMVGSGSYTQGFAGITSGGMSIGNDGVVSWINLVSGVGMALHTFSASGGETLIDTGSTTATGLQSAALPTASGNVVLTTRGGGVGYYLGSTFVTDTKAAAAFCADADGIGWGLFQPTGSSNQFELRQLVGGTASHVLTGPVTRSGFSGANVCYSSTYSHFFIVMDGHRLTVDTATWTVTDHGTMTLLTNQLPSKRANAATFFDSLSEYSLADGALIRTIAVSSYAPNETGSSGVYYDLYNNALFTGVNASPSARIDWYYLDRHGGYRVAGPIYANQEFLEVEEMFALATAGNVITREGSVELEPGQAKSVVATITDDDILVGSEVQWNQGFLSEANSEWVNTVVARYVEPAQKWNDHAAPVLRDNADILADGKPREASITLRLVRYQPQALRVAEIARRLGRLWGRANLKLGPRFCELEEGDWIAWTSDRYFGGATGTFRIESYSIDEKWQVALTLREITPGVFADDASAFWPPDLSVSQSSPIPPDIGEPEADNWALAAVTLDSPGASVPALEVTGSADDDDYVSEIIVEYWLDDGILDPVADPDSIPWTSAGHFPASTTKVDITSVVGAETYYAAVSYVVSGSTGDRLVLGPVTLAGFGTGIRTADTTFITADDTTRRADLG